MSHLFGVGQTGSQLSVQECEWTLEDERLVRRLDTEFANVDIQPEHSKPAPKPLPAHHANTSPNRRLHGQEDALAPRQNYTVEEEFSDQQCTRARGCRCQACRTSQLSLSMERSATVEDGTMHVNNTSADRESRIRKRQLRKQNKEVPSKPAPTASLPQGSGLMGRVMRATSQPVVPPPASNVNTGVRRGMAGRNIKKVIKKESVGNMKAGLLKAQAKLDGPTSASDNPVGGAVAEEMEARRRMEERLAAAEESVVRERAARLAAEEEAAREKAARQAIEAAAGRQEVSPDRRYSMQKRLRDFNSQKAGQDEAAVCYYLGFMIAVSSLRMEVCLSCPLSAFVIA